MGEGRVAPGHLHREALGARFVEDRRDALVEDQGVVGAVPGGQAAVDREIVGQHPGIGRRFRDLYPRGNIVDGGLAEAGVDVHEVIDVLVRIGLFELFQHELRALAVERTHTLQLRLLRVGRVVDLAAPQKLLGHDAAHDQRGVLCLFREADEHGIARVFRVGGGRPVHADALAAESCRSALPGGGEGLIGDALDLVDGLLCESQLLHHSPGNFFAVLRRIFFDEVGDTALDDGLVEEARGGGHLHKRVDLHAAAGLAEDGDVVRVAAETGDVVPHPPQGHDDVVHARGAGEGVLLSKFGEVEIAQDVQPVVDGDHHHVSPAAEILAVIADQFQGRAVAEAAAVDPEHDGLLRRLVQRRRPDVEHLTVLALGPVAHAEVHAVRLQAGAVQGQAHRAVHAHIPDPLPGRDGRGGQKALGLGVGHAAELVNPVHQEAAQLAGFRLDDGGVKGAEKTHVSFSFYRIAAGLIVHRFSFLCHKNCAVSAGTAQCLVKIS